MGKLIALCGAFRKARNQSAYLRNAVTLPEEEILNQMFAINYIQHSQSQTPAWWFFPAIQAVNENP
jgi:hypothetical protein